MARIIEHDVIQNVGLSALILHRFINSYCKTAGQDNGPRLAMVMPVLPLLYHQKTLDHIHKKRFIGGFFSAVGDYREIPAGLQQRMEDMASQSFGALHLACQVDILNYSKELDKIVLGSVTVSSLKYNSEIKRILYGADRLGYWFATLPFEQICMMLKLRF